MSVSYRYRVSVPLPAARAAGASGPEPDHLAGDRLHLVEHEVHSTLQLRLGHAPVRREANAAWKGVDDDTFRVELRLDCFRLVAPEGDDPAAA